MTAPLRVLMSFPRPREVTNPFNTLLMDAVAARPGVTVHTFSWRRALLGDYDVFHVHWPEILVDGHSPLKKVVRQALFAGLLLRLKLSGRPLVRTLHNLELPQGITARERVLLRWAERWTTLWIVINTSTTGPDGAASALSLHGHYRDWYDRLPRAEVAPGRVGFFGRIRRYKNAVGLVLAFRELDDPSLELRIAGMPSSDALTDEITAAAGDDARIDLDFRFIDDPDLVRLVTSSELVVLPYPEMHNSGSAFAALSMGRPVLLPDNEVNRLLAEEVGSGFVQLFSGDLTGNHIRAALDAVRELPADARPDLSQREWPLIGEQHEAAYREAIALTRLPWGRQRSLKEPV
ncbi:glycosyl transferase [Propioniciclava soli]|uniref:glycosyl transferase n=1 Tax=Propioniciclava soli TaxID=2775081 RepID=UPI001E478BC1|nr:glycosyl transferase [Propioniciclava soli]